MNLVEALVGSKPSRLRRREPGETDTQRLGGALRRGGGGRWGAHVEVEPFLDTLTEQAQVTPS